MKGPKMRAQDRKAAVDAYKKRRSIAGIYALRCAASGQLWVGRTQNLDAVENRIRFTLRFGSHSSRSLSEAWSAHGEENFAFEPLERLEEEEPSHFRDLLLEERAAFWRAKLGAGPSTYRGASVLYGFRMITS